MDQFVFMEDAFAPSCGEGDGLVELLWCRGHVAMPMRSQPSPPVEEHEPAPWFQYTVRDDPLDKELFSEIFGEMPADGACRVTAGSDTADYSSPPRGSDASTTVTSSSMRPQLAGAASRSSVKRKQSSTSESPSEVTQNAEDSDSVTTRGPAQRTSTGNVGAPPKSTTSQRGRRDRINEKMRALQELVPDCNKTDKVSMLDEAIEYLKSLQLQVQMMWTTGAGMAPASAMFPVGGAHRYMQRMASTRSRMQPLRTCDLRIQ